MKKTGIQFQSRIDWFIILPAMILSAISIFFVFSSGIDANGNNVKTEYIRQIIWSVFGLILFVTFALLKYDFLKEISLFIFIGFLILVLVTIFFGKTVNGAKLWLGIGDFGIQPSEFLKIATILLVARMLDRLGEKISMFRNVILVSLLVMVPVAFILAQPDLGTALVFIPILIFMLFIAGAQLKHVLFILFLLILTALFTFLPAWDYYIYAGKVPILDIFTNKALIIFVFALLVTIIVLSILGLRLIKKQYFYWILYAASIVLIAYSLSLAVKVVLKDYQLQRLIVFLDPYIDEKGSGWNIIQSITAVGSGGFGGKGYLHGTQSHYQYLPEQSTDFIFSIIGEEFGFLGSLVIFACYTTILVRIFFIIRASKDAFAATVAAGIGAVIFFHIIINIGMTIGIMPITGIPLLLVSYGGSSVLSTLISLGILSSISSNRYNF